MSNRELTHGPTLAPRLLRSAAVIAGLLLWYADAVAERVAPSARVTSFVTVRDAPRPGAQDIGHLATGASAKLLRNTRYWRAVRLDDGRTGYVSRSWTVVTPDDAPADPLIVTFIDVGEGDAIHLQLGALDILVDAGPSWTPNLQRSLQAIDGRLEHFWLTHPHGDHYGAGAEVLANYEVGDVRSNGETRGPPRDGKQLKTWEAFTRAVAAEARSIEQLEAGEVITPAHGLTIQVLATGGRFEDTAQGSDINNDSLVLMVTFAGRRVLLTGDIEAESARQLVNTYCEQDPSCPDLRADVLKVPHHGSASLDLGLFKKVAATWAVISADFNNKHGGHCLPRREPIDELRRNGTKIVSTSAQGDENATLTITAAGDLSWSLPTSDVFAWDLGGTSCDDAGTVTYRQGT